MRRPKMYLKLPSGGKYWPEGSIDMPENGEIPVYGLTVKDELLVRTPDALFNGHTTVEVIKSCFPNIKDPWQMPSIDLDAVLIAMRIASYGEKMSMTVNIPNVGEQENFEVDLRPFLDNLINNTHWEETVKIDNDLTFIIHPVNYKAMTDFQLINFDSNRIVRALADKDLSEEQRMNLSAMAMDRIATATVGQLINGVVRIESSNGNTNDKNHIREFLENIDKDIFKRLTDAFSDLNRHNNSNVFTISTPPQYIERGAPEQFDVPFEFDYSTFFA